MNTETRTCPICGASDWRPRYSPLVECSHCGLVATDPQSYRPEQAVYDEAYYTERNACLSSAEVFTASYRRLLERIRLFKAAGALLDVGCGIGYLVGLAVAMGYDASGCDTSEWATAHASKRGLNVRTGAIEELMVSSATFDVVVINHTLEHISQPVPFLTELHRILKPDGVLAIGVPNFECLFSKLLRSHWAGLLPDQHIWHFTQNTLQRMLDRADFQVKFIEVAPYVHRHASPAKNLILRTLSGIANRTHTSDNLVAIASKGRAENAHGH